MSLYPTKTRLALLQAVADGAVERDGLGLDLWDDIDRQPRTIRVTARITELEYAGWVRLTTALRSRSGERLPQLWELTTTGRDILHGYGDSPAATS